MINIPIESFNLQMLNVGFVKHNGDWNWRNVSSPFTRIFYVKEGEALLHLPDKTIKLRPNYLYVIPPYVLHSYECDGPFVHYYLHVYESFKSEMDLMELYDFPTEVEGCRDDELLLLHMCEQYPQAKLPSSDPEVYDNVINITSNVKRYHNLSLWQKMELRGAMLMLFSRFLRNASPHLWTCDERMRRVREYIHSHICEEVEIDELAKVVCITKTYLIRLFKQEFGTSPLQYINKKKVERAQLLLCTTDMAIKEVAYKLGFNDQSYFIRMYRKVTGITPQEYRKQQGL